MALEKVVSFDHSISELKQIHVRKITRILEDGKVISKSYHRHVVCPGESFEGQDDATVAVATVIHTPEVVEEYQARIAENDYLQ